MIRLYQQDNGNVVLADAETGGVAGTLIPSQHGFSFTPWHVGGPYRMGEYDEVHLIHRPVLAEMERSLTDLLAYDTAPDPPPVAMLLDVVRGLMRGHGRTA